MLAQILVVTFVLCLALAAASLLLSRQLVTSYASELLRHHFYYLGAFYAFVFYGLWGQVLARGLLASLGTNTEVVEVVAGFIPMLGVPFLFVSWLMLVSMAFSMFGRTVGALWIWIHVGAFLLVLLGVWLGVAWAQEELTPAGNLGLVEALVMIALELGYFLGFLVLVWRLGSGFDPVKRRVLLTFAGLLFGAFVARSLLAGLVLVDVRLGAVALLGYFASNLAPLLYLRANADKAFEPMRAAEASPLGMEHVFERYGITRRERQIVEKVCLGKTNKQIADELFISLQTVKDHTHRIYSKIGINSRMQLVQVMNAAK
jgi:DNA-binding CsgD family transcriptional regulator